MPLLNYTTEIPVNRTVGQVQQLLAKAGARMVVAEYDEQGEVCGLTFTVRVPYGMQPYTLPVHPEKVRSVLARDKVPNRFRSEAHAAKVAWRILKDWVEAQLAIVATEMVTLDQVMLPYARTETGGTVYGQYLEHHRRRLRRRTRAVIQ